MKANHERGIIFIFTRPVHYHVSLRRMRFDPISEVCLLVNTYEVTLPYQGDIFIDQQSLNHFLHVSQNGVKSGKKERRSSGQCKSSGMENITVVGIPVKEIRRQVDLINRKLEGRWGCSQCGKEARTKQNSEHHIETHIRGVEFLCNLCNKRLRSTSSAKYHVCKRRESGA